MQIVYHTVNGIISTILYLHQVPKKSGIWNVVPRYSKYIEHAL